MVKKYKVCKECARLTEDNQCPVCNSNQLVDKYKGRVLILNGKESEVAKKLNIEDNGNYALKY